MTQCKVRNCAVKTGGQARTRQHVRTQQLNPGSGGTRAIITYRNKQLTCLVGNGSTAQDTTVHDDTWITKCMGENCQVETVYIGQTRLWYYNCTIKPVSLWRARLPSWMSSSATCTLSCADERLVPSKPPITRLFCRNTTLMVPAKYLIQIFLYLIQFSYSRYKENIPLIKRKFRHYKYILPLKTFNVCRPWANTQTTCSKI